MSNQITMKALVAGSRMSTPAAVGLLLLVVLPSAEHAHDDRALSIASSCVATMSRSLSTAQLQNLGDLATIRAHSSCICQTACQSMHQRNETPVRFSLISHAYCVASEMQCCKWYFLQERPRVWRGVLPTTMAQPQVENYCITDLRCG